MGKCSLTVALPVISSLGIEAVVLPTAILSAHTVFKGYTFTDTTKDVESILNHFDKMGETFDCIYIGYLGSENQIKIVSDFIDNHRESIIITDPVMGDGGKLYSGFKNNYPEYMRKLCEKSHIILPNLTEASLISSTPFMDYPTTRHIERIADSLCNMSKNVVITGVKENDSIGVYTKKGNTPLTKTISTPLVDRQFHGTGDVFASVFCGLYTLGFSLEESTKQATLFTEKCINATVKDKDSQWYGLRFEECLPYLYNLRK